MKKAVVTLCIGEAYSKLSAVSHPALKRYADRLGADFLVISERKYPGAPAGYEKLQLKKYLETYDRIVYLDTDLIVREDTPDLFAYVPQGIFGAFPEGDFIPARAKQLEDGMRQFGLSAPKFGKYYNTGVMVFDRSHAGVFSEPHEFIDHFYEQTYLNIQLARNLVVVRDLSHKFNRMTHIDEAGISKEPRHGSYIIHYAGGVANIGVDKIAEIMKEDLKTWDVLKPDYHVPKVIKVSLGGGLGDQICAEPVVREIRRLYPRDRIIVATHWPEIFSNHHYSIEAVDIKKHWIPEEIYAVFHTYSSPDGEAWSYMTHIFAHSTDFSSQLAIRRVLPPEKKSIELRYTNQEKNSMLGKLNLLPGEIAGAICLHPGRSWRTKTMSSSFWNEVIKGAAKLGRPVVVFGKDGPKGQGLVPVEVPPGVIDARDKLTLKESLALLDMSAVLLSNDSAPIHLAGATEIWILGIFTAKHPAFVLPFRHGTQEYKTRCLNLRPSCWPCNVDAVTTSIDEVRADYCSNLEQPYSCFPSAEYIVDQLKCVESLL